jgi:hypothetical protein
LSFGLTYVFLQEQLDDGDLGMAFMMCQVQLPTRPADGARSRDEADGLRPGSKRMAAMEVLLVRMR